MVRVAIGKVRVDLRVKGQLGPDAAVLAGAVVAPGVGADADRSSDLRAALRARVARFGSDHGEIGIRGHRVSGIGVAAPRAE